MKAKTKLQKEVAKINKRLSETISVSDANWAKNQSKYWDMTHYCYFTIFTNIKEWEVKRLYRIYSFADKNTTHYFFVEILRKFYDGSNTLYFGKQRQMGRYYDCFTFSSGIEFREVRKNYANNDITMLFDLSMESREEHKGKRINCVNVNPKEMGKAICNNPIAEMLYKNNDPLFYSLLWNGYKKEVCRAYVIAKRHGFEFTDDNTSIWLDMVRAIAYCKYDFHNPFYVAPKDLMATHDRFVKMRNRKRLEAERQLFIRERTKIVDDINKDNRINEAYIRRRKRFYDMVLTDGLITIKVLPDVPAFREEAFYMKHCVYGMEYYRKPYSLIMSATIEGNRIETIEVDLTRYQIKQCFGKNNSMTMYHKRIVDLVNSEMKTIKKYNESKRKASKAIAKAI